MSMHGHGEGKGPMGCAPALLPFSMKSNALHLIMAWKMSKVRESGPLTRLYLRLSQCLGLKLSPTCTKSTGGYIVQDQKEDCVSCHP